MTLPHTALGPVAFAMGVALEAALPVLLRPRRGDAWRLAIAIAPGLLGLVPMRGEHFAPRSDPFPYSVQLHLYLVVAAVGLGLVWQFGERLFPRVGSSLLLAWSLVTLAAAWSLDGHAGPAMPLALLTVALAVVNAFTGLARTVAGQLLLFAAYATTLVVLAFVEWRAAAWTGLENFVGSINTRSAVGNVLAGAALYAAAAGAGFVFRIVWRALAPRRADRPSTANAWAPDHRMRSVAILVVLPLVLIGNTYRQVVEPSRLVAALLALLPLLAMASARDAGERSRAS